VDRSSRTSARRGVIVSLTLKEPQMAKKKAKKKGKKKK
jgi:hypothetical protein